ncbi:hypothetical protein [Massilia sp. DWR3-1-1]|uniref:hypothetical protein n=1 Tax=Massilia sp. DWR3-1-1 TaxID=2804559 RepID=UPI003CF4C2AA
MIHAKLSAETADVAVAMVDWPGERAYSAAQLICPTMLSGTWIFTRPTQGEFSRKCRAAQLIAATAPPATTVGLITDVEWSMTEFSPAFFFHSTAVSLGETNRRACVSMTLLALCRGTCLLPLLALWILAIGEATT